MRVLNKGKTESIIIQNDGILEHNLPLGIKWIKWPFKTMGTWFSLDNEEMINCIPGKSWGYLGFSTVTPPQRFPFGRKNLKNILVRPFKFGMWVYMGNATNAIVL